jgi:hypothetical protein
VSEAPFVLICGGTFFDRRAKALEVLDSWRVRYPDIALIQVPDEGAISGESAISPGAPAAERNHEMRVATIFCTRARASELMQERVGLFHRADVVFDYEPPPPPPPPDPPWVVAKDDIDLQRELNEIPF